MQLPSFKQVAFILGCSLGLSVFACGNGAGGDNASDYADTTYIAPEEPVEVTPDTTMTPEDDTLSTDTLNQ